jgi:hypothetical protein
MRSHDNHAEGNARLDVGPPIVAQMMCTELMWLADGSSVGLLRNINRQGP